MGDGPLRPCTYPSTDARYMKDCLTCLQNAGTTQNIIAGETPIYTGSSMTYAHTQYHGGSYDDVPIRAKIPYWQSVGFDSLSRPGTCASCRVSTNSTCRPCASSTSCGAILRG